MFLGLAGWAVLAAALLTPLCNLSVALFAARAAQHVLITLVAAPLLVMARYVLVDGRMLGGRVRPLPAALVFAVVLWFWHVPAFYDQTLRDNVVYWTMHLSLFGAALMLWRSLIGAGVAGFGARLLASLLTGFQMCALGAILTLSPRAWFAVYADTTWPWGLSPAADQQLGGVIMWVVGGILLAGLTAALFASGLARTGVKMPQSAPSG